MASIGVHHHRVQLWRHFRFGSSSKLSKEFGASAQISLLRCDKSQQHSPLKSASKYIYAIYLKKKKNYIWQRESKSLTSGGSSCSQMQLVTSPLQLLPPLLLLSPRLLARLAVTAVLLLLLFSPLHFPTLPMRQRPWAESPPPLSSPTSADSGAAVCTSTLWPSSSCTLKITTSVSAAAAVVAG